MTSAPLKARKRVEAVSSFEGGSAMVVALIFLLLMAMMGTSAMRGTTMQERMAGNMRDWNLAFQAAEAALREAEDFLQGTPALPEFDDDDGLYQINSAARPVFTPGAESDGGGFITYGADVAGTAQRPRYYIEELPLILAGQDTELGGPVDLFHFRITAVGYGGAVGADGNPVAAVVLSSVYRTR